MATPLFEEEGDVMLNAEVSQLAYPVGVDATMTRAGFAASDEPVDPVEVEPFNGPSKGSALRTDSSGNVAERIGGSDEAAVLDRHPHPDVWRPFEVAR